LWRIEISSLLPEVCFEGRRTLTVSGCHLFRFAVAQNEQLSENPWFSGSLRSVAWWLDINVSEDRSTSIFRVEVRGQSEL
jgi:hypothetical protein